MLTSNVITFDITGSFEVEIGNEIIEKANCAKFLVILIDSKLE